LGRVVGKRVEPFGVREKANRCGRGGIRLSPYLERESA